MHWGPALGILHWGFCIRVPCLGSFIWGSALGPHIWGPALGVLLWGPHIWGSAFGVPHFGSCIWFCTWVLHWAFCTGGSTFGALHWGSCIGGPAMGVLHREHHQHHSLPGHLCTLPRSSSTVLRMWALDQDKSELCIQLGGISGFISEQVTNVPKSGP